MKTKIERMNENWSPKLTVMSLAEKVKGQGVGSAFHEQYDLVRARIGDRIDIKLNTFDCGEVTHYHTINFRFYLHALMHRHKTVRVASVHFIPETMDGSIYLPWFARKVFYRYIIRFYKSMDHLVTVNPAFIEKLEALGIDRENIEYIPNFVSRDQFNKMSKGHKWDTKIRYGYSPDDFVVLGVGQIQTRKGIIDFIETAKKIPDIKFIWAGGFSFGKITDGYEILKEVVGNPPENVKFIGIVDRDEMNDVYNLADVLFLPSYNELFPMTILEAMSVQLPILLRSLPVYEDILFDFYLQANDNGHFSQLIRQLSNAPGFYDFWSSQSKKGSDCYNRESIGSMWENFYYRMFEMEGSVRYDNNSEALN
jgi:1,2-diacylglycerol-3-alpha-glucose alpha-1,2-galactosyltransferase